MALEVRHVGEGPPGQTGVTNNIPASPTVVPLNVLSTQVSIQNQTIPGTSGVTLYVRYGGGTCTTSDFSIAAGSGFTYDGSPIGQVCVLGSAATGTYSLFAH